jgi:hypothetical protein
MLAVTVERRRLYVRPMIAAAVKPDAAGAPHVPSRIAGGTGAARSGLNSLLANMIGRYPGIFNPHRNQVVTLP